MRVAKYIRQGFLPCAGTMQAIALACRNATDEAMEVKYVD